MMTLAIARRLSTTRTLVSDVSISDVFAMNAALDAFHASRVAAGIRAAATRRVKAAEHMDQIRAARARQAAIRAGITRRIARDIRA